jgi:ATP-binding cassette subfamily B (MDR/TAP) protein 8
MPVLYGVLNLYGNYLRKLSKQGKELDGIASGLAGEVSDTGFSVLHIMDYQL